MAGAGNDADRIAATVVAPPRPRGPRRPCPRSRMHVYATRARRRSLRRMRCQEQVTMLSLKKKKKNISPKKRNTPRAARKQR